MCMARIACLRVIWSCLERSNRDHLIKRHTISLITGPRSLKCLTSLQEVMALKSFASAEFGL